MMACTYRVNQSSWTRSQLLLLLAFVAVAAGLSNTAALASSSSSMSVALSTTATPPSATPAVLYKRKKIVVEGDLMIGALLPVHEQPSHRDDEAPTLGSKRKCGVIRDQYGVQRVEALLFMLDKINRNDLSLLPGIKIGLEIRDECWDSSIALEETIDFIKDTIASDSSDEDGEAGSRSSHLQIVSEPGGGNSNNDFTAVAMRNNSSDLRCSSAVKTKNQNRILAVIGPAGSTVSINVQNLLQLFDIPQVGYSATSGDLSDKKMYKTFLRVVPSDYLQVRAMADLVVRMNWTYIFAIYTEGSYGQAGMEAFRNETYYLNICLPLYEKIREYASDEDYEAMIRKMNTTTNARVIVCFCYGETIRGLLGAIHRLNLKGRFLIVGSDGWSDRIDVAKDYYEEALGSFSIKAYSPEVEEFNDYFINLNPSNNMRNVWFVEYWEDRFKCYIEEASKAKYKTPCKRKCPTSFVSIGKNCYFFSAANANWKEAQRECKDKYFHSDLLDLDDQQDLNEIIEHLVSQRMHDHLAQMHAQIKLTRVGSSSASIEAGSFEKRTEIKLPLCKRAGGHSTSVYATHRLLRSFGKHGHHREPTKSVSSYELSNYEVGNEELVTFYNSRFGSDLQCLSIRISAYNSSTSSGSSSNEHRSNYSYCAVVKNCDKHLPFICKYDVSALKKNGSKHSHDLYPDTLRNYQQDPKMSYVVNSMLAIVHGLDKVHKSYCNGVDGLCERMKKVNGSELLKNIKESVFYGMTKERIYFDVNGDPPGRYVILNVQKDVNEDNVTRYVYRKVGSWDNIYKLNLDVDSVRFPNESKAYKSVCSERCAFGHVKQIKQGGMKCCWNCKKCDEHAYVLDEFTCQDCDLGFWPNRNLTRCEKLPLDYLQWNEPAALFALLFSLIGIIINTFTTHVFIKYAHTCVVKSTTKELSYIILVGIYLCYLMTVPLIMKPTVFTCYLSRILPGLSLSLIYGALITKTNRIARILARSKKRILTKKPRFMSLTAQILITCIIIAIECGLIVAAFVAEPEHILLDYPKRNKVVLICYNSLVTVLGPIGYNMFLVFLCTLYAVRTRNLPENFNEAKFIGFSMYTTCVIWIAFIPLYFGSDFKAITLSLSTSFSATVILVLIFFPKVYIILFKPEKNQRSAFATSKDLRMHFGSSVPSQHKDSSIEADRNSTVHPRKGISFLEKYGMKQPIRVSLKSDSLATNPVHRGGGAQAATTTGYARNAQRSKTVYSMRNKSVDMDSFETFTSIYQVADRSCQTSLELLAGLGATSSGRRRTTKFLDDSGSLTDDHDLFSIQPKATSSRKKSMLEIRTSSSNCLNTIDALGSFALYPLIATQTAASSITEGEENTSRTEPEQTPVKAAKFASFKLGRSADRRSISVSVNDTTNSSSQFVMANSAIEEESLKENGSFEEAANRSAVSGGSTGSSQPPAVVEHVGGLKKRGSSFFGKSLKKLNKHTNLKLATIKDKIDQKITSSIIPDDDSVSLEVLNEMKLRDKLLKNESMLYAGKNTLDTASTTSPRLKERRHQLKSSSSRQSSSLRRTLEPPDSEADLSTTANNSSHSSTAYLSAATTNQEASSPRPVSSKPPVFRVTDQLNDSSMDMPVNENDSSCEPTTTAQFYSQATDTSANEGDDSVDLRIIKEGLEDDESCEDAGAKPRPAAANLDRQVDESLEDFKKLFASSQNNLVINWDYVHSTSGYL